MVSLRRWTARLHAKVGQWQPGNMGAAAKGGGCTVLALKRAVSAVNGVVVVKGEDGGGWMQDGWSRHGLIHGLFGPWSR